MQRNLPSRRSICAGFSGGAPRTHQHAQPEGIYNHNILADVSALDLCQRARHVRRWRPLLRGCRPFGRRSRHLGRAHVCSPWWRGIRSRQSCLARQSFPRLGRWVPWRRTCGAFRKPRVWRQSGGSLYGGGGHGQITSLGGRIRCARRLTQAPPILNECAASLWQEYRPLCMVDTTL